MEPTPPIGWWRWPTVLSLDAPAVVLGWQAVLAHVARVRLEWPQAFVLMASVWLAYAADRWIEGWRLAPATVRTARHAFYQRWRWTDVRALDDRPRVGSVGRTDPSFLRELQAGWLVVPPVLAYLLSHQFVHRNRRWRAPKEACVALLLGAGVALFPLAHPGPYHRHLWPTLVLFVLLCFANCALISIWEREVDRSHGQTSLALQFESAGWIHVLPWALVVVAAAFGLVEAGDARVAAACAAGSAAVLALVDRLHPRLGRRLARVLADVALLTPIRGDGTGRARVKRPSFDRLAGVYRLLEFAAFGRDLERARFCLLDRLAPCTRILVLGEGDGCALERLLALAPAAEIHCVDISAAMLAGASARRTVGGRVRCDLHQIDAVASPLPDGTLRCRDDDVLPGLLHGSSNCAGWSRELPERSSRMPRGCGRTSACPSAAGGDCGPVPRLDLLYAFFRWQTGITARQLPPAEAIITSAGFSSHEYQDRHGGMVRTRLFKRERSSAP